MLARAGCSNVEALNMDFLTTDVSDEKYAHVTHMYVRSVHTCQLCLTHLTKIVSLIRPAVVLESLIASTTSWNLVRFVDFMASELEKGRSRHQSRLLGTDKRRKAPALRKPNASRS